MQILQNDKLYNALDLFLDLLSFDCFDLLDGLLEEQLVSVDILRRGGKSIQQYYNEMNQGVCVCVCVCVCVSKTL